MFKSLSTLVTCPTIYELIPKYKQLNPGERWSLSIKLPFWKVKLVRWDNIPCEISYVWELLDPVFSLNAQVSAVMASAFNFPSCSWISQIWQWENISVTSQLNSCHAFCVEMHVKLSLKLHLVQNAMAQFLKDYPPLLLQNPHSLSMHIWMPQFKVLLTFKTLNGLEVEFFCHMNVLLYIFYIYIFTVLIFYAGKSPRRIRIKPL